MSELIDIALSPRRAFPVGTFASRHDSATPSSAIPLMGSWQTTDAYLAGAIRTKLAAAEAAAALDPSLRT